MPQENFQSEEGEQTFAIPDFTGGVNTYQHYNKAHINTLRKAKNAVYSKSGYVVRRPGFQQLGGEFAAADTCLTILGAGSEDNRKLYIQYKSGTNRDVSAWNGSLWYTSDLAGSSADTDFPCDGSWVREESGSEFVYMANGSAPIGKYPVGSTATDIDVADGAAAFIPTNNDEPEEMGRTLTSFQGRLWYGGFVNAEHQQRDSLFYTDVLIPEKGGWNQAVNVLKFDGEVIVAVRPFKNNLLMVGTDVSIYLVAIGESLDFLDWQILKVSNDIGVGSVGSLSQGRDDYFFVDNAGNARQLKITLTDFSGGVEPIPMSFPIKDQLDLLAGDNEGDKSRIDYMVGSFNDGKYLLNGRNGTLDGTTGQGWCYDSYQGGVWTGPMTYVATSLDDDTGSNVTAMNTVSSGFGFSTAFFKNRQTRTYLGIYSEVDTKMVIGYLDPTIYQDDDDEATARNISVEVETQFQDFGLPHLDKIVKTIEVEYGDEESGFSGTGSFEVLGRRDFASTWDYLDTVTYDANTKISSAFINCLTLGRGRVFQFRFVDQSATNGPRLRRMWLRFQTFPAKNA